MRKDLRIQRQIIGTIIITLLIFSTFSSPVSAHTGDETEIPRNTPPTIDGIVEIEEWNGSETITLDVEGNQADIHFKHDRENFYFGFDIQEGHNSAFPDTRVFFDTLHDSSDSPQEDDVQFYINPDNGGLQERQGDGQEWQEVDIEHWTGDWDEDTSEHWTTEYMIDSEKFGNFTGNETFGFCLLVWGNSPTANDVWPNGADIDDPSTWGHLSFLNWTEEEDPNQPPTDPPGGNETDPNGTANQTGDDDDDDGFIPLSLITTIGGMGGGALAIFWRRRLA